MPVGDGQPQNGDLVEVDEDNDDGTLAREQVG